MPTALERLLASPSAVRALRAFVYSPQLLRTISPAGFSTCTNRRSESNRIKGDPIPTENESPDPTVRLRPSFRHYKAVNLHSELRTSIWPRIDRRVDPEEKDEIITRALVHMERVHGADGLRQLWLGLLRRGYVLPTKETRDVDILWSTLLKLPDLVPSLIEHATRIRTETGQMYPKLYQVCIGFWILKDPDMALNFHHQLVLKLKMRRLPLRGLAQYIRHSPKALEAFMEIYRTSNERDIYDEIVPVLCDRGEVSIARWWHTMCIQRNDLPSATVESHPEIAKLLADFAPVAMESASNPQRPEQAGSPDPKPNPNLNEKLKRRLLGRQTAAVRFDDSFCAKLFATKAFHPSSIIQGLVMAGVNEIGPQALRVLGLRSDPLPDLQERLKELKEAGIALKGCVFSLAVETFTSDGKIQLVRSILDSDQHPDVFDERETQLNLLDYYLKQNDWVQAHRTLAILALFHNDIANESWNILLQARIRVFEADQFVGFLRDMLANQARVTSDSLLAIKSLIGFRKQGHNPRTSPGSRLDNLRFVTQVYVMILRSGNTYISPLFWREILRRYGMLGRVKELRRLVLWLLTWYAPRTGAKFLDLPKPAILDSTTEELPKARVRPQFHWNPPKSVTRSKKWHKFHPITQLFPPSFQQGLIVWGFRAGLMPNSSLEQSLFNTPADKKHHRKSLRRRGLLRRVHWSSGLGLVKELNNLGVHVHPHTVTKTLQAQMINLFGRGRSNKRANRIMERANRTEYAEYVHVINEVWDEPLLSLPRSYSSPSHEVGTRWHPIWHPRMSRGLFRGELKIEEILGPNWRKIEEQREYEQNEVEVSTEERTSNPNAGEGVDLKEVTRKRSLSYMGQSSLGKGFKG